MMRIGKLIWLNDSIYNVSLLSLLLLPCILLLLVPNPVESSRSSSSPKYSIRLPGDPYTVDWDETSSSSSSSSTKGKSNQNISNSKRRWIFGAGREFSLFDSRGGGIGNGSRSESDDENEFLERYRRARLEQQGRYGLYGSPSRGNRQSSSSSSSFSKSQRPQIFQTIHDWWSTNIQPSFQDMPKIICRVEPTTTLKLRKTFRPLKTIVRIGADFNSQLGVWQFTSSWEDAIIGGKLTLAGKELQLTKSWQLSVGAVEDLVTRLRFRAAINLQTCQAYARVGFRTERMSPINVMEGFTILKQVPLDGNQGNVKLEVKANVALPEPEIEYSTETQRSLVGMGDVEVSIDELNLVLDY